jgi:hypothetical protein
VAKEKESEYGSGTQTRDDREENPVWLMDRQQEAGKEISNNLVDLEKSKELSLRDGEQMRAEESALGHVRCLCCDPLSPLLNSWTKMPNEF